MQRLVDSCVAGAAMGPSSCGLLPHSAYCIPGRFPMASSAYLDLSDPSEHEHNAAPLRSCWDDASENRDASELEGCH